MKASGSDISIGDVFVKYGLPWFEESFKEGLFLRSRECIFNHAMTMWLMVVQKRKGHNSLSAAIQNLKSTSLENVGKLVAGSKKLLHSGLSNNAGAFCQARKRLPIEQVEIFFDHMSKKVEEEQESQIFNYKTYILDGSTIGLQKNSEILQEFSTQNNQYGQFQPAARIVTAHNIITGTALRPEIGDIRVSEQELSVAVMHRIAKNSLIIGDRNFGIFSVAYHAEQCKLKSLIRLQETRARKILGKKAKDKIKDGEYSITWKASDNDCKGNDFSSGASIAGKVWVVTKKARQFKPQRFYFFTTATELTSAQVMEVYQKRWFIETDLRTIKGTMELDTIEAETPDVAKKEILLGVLAYTLIRSVIAKGASALELEPRDLSFSRSFEFINTISIQIHRAKSVQEIQFVLESFLPGLRQLKHPKRTQPRFEPRKIATGYKKKFPPMHCSRAVAQGNIIIKLRA